MLGKREFCECAEVLRNYGLWERMVYNWGIDLDNTPISPLAEQLQRVMCGFNTEWDYDTKLGFSWLIEWSFGESPFYYQVRHGREFDLHDAGALYDFLVFMNEKGWEEDE